MIYEVLTNLDNDYWTGYTIGEKLVFSYRGHVDMDGMTGFVPVLEAIFHRHNMDDRPDGQMNPSLSIGDVVRLWDDGVKGGWTSWTPTRIGWDRVDVIPQNVERHIPWTALVHTNKRSN